ncbi:hypothetical protein CDL15_Pgr011448 [Punica granatum]|uniref:Uncharacterized protein n=1 Tax=Punica granatum TaxID=22663 RepID=A0A218WG36_PUNGR|nr:hypothetical protein CDL15_Pgr011448 [Punica granatum]PKI40419.1 hypothetical protein CRG98_039196 [Punica granatum]
MYKGAAAASTGVEQLAGTSRGRFQAQIAELHEPGPGAPRAAGRAPRSSKGAEIAAGTASSSNRGEEGRLGKEFSNRAATGSV